jgi:hypothetical protein
MCSNPAEGYNFEAMPGGIENPLMIFATDLTEIWIDYSNHCAGDVKLRSTFRLKACECAVPDSQPVNGALPVTLEPRVVSQVGERGVEVYSEHPKKTEELFPRDSLIVLNLQIAVRSENPEKMYVLQKETSCPVCLCNFGAPGVESTRWEVCRHEICTKCKQSCEAKCEEQGQPVRCPVCRREEFLPEQSLHTGLHFTEDEKQQSLLVQKFETSFQNLWKQDKYADMYNMFQEADPFVQTYARNTMWKYMERVLYEKRSVKRRKLGCT